MSKISERDRGVIPAGGKDFIPTIVSSASRTLKCSRVGAMRSADVGNVARPT
jgi:hypothetical protein